MNERTIFVTALEIDADVERSAYLDEACAGHPELRQRIGQLLEAYHEPGEFLDVPAPAQLAAARDCSADKTLGFEETSKETPLSKPMSEDSEAIPEPIESGELEDEGVLALLQSSDKAEALGQLDHYTIEEILGRGAFGIVFRAFDEKLNRVVALKVMAPQLATSDNARKRFIREAQAAAAIRDEHVCAVHAVEEVGLLPYLVMEFIDGITLAEKLEQTGRFEVEEVLRIGIQTARGLAAAHNQGLIHRDIKPGNLLLENNLHRVKITDFGLARTADDASLSQAGVIAGTPMYMSSEQAHGEVLDHRTDLFSLGSVLYTLCTGQPAFLAETTMAVLKRVCEDTPRPIRELNPDTPEWLEAIITKLMAKEPADRYSSAEELAEVLERCLAHLQHPDTSPSPLGNGSATRPPRRRWLYVTACLLFVAVLGFAGWKMRQATYRTPEGTFHVEINDPEVEARFQNGKIRIYSKDGKLLYTLQPSERNKPLPPGQYMVKVVGADGLIVDTPEFTMNDRGKVTARVRLQGPARMVSPPKAVWPDWPADAPPPALVPFNAEQAKQHQQAWAKYLGVQVEYTNSIGMTFVLIPPGEFTMGVRQRILRRRSHQREVSRSGKRPQEAQVRSTR